MTITINGTTGITTPEITLDNTAADGGQVVLKSSGYSDWNLDNYSGRLRGYYGSTEYWTVTASGNVGIGTSSPQAQLHLYGASAALRITDQTYPASDYWVINSTSDTFHINKQISGAPNNGNVLNIDSSGNLLVGTTTVSNSGKVNVYGANGTTGFNIQMEGVGVVQTPARFMYGATNVGSITCNSTGTGYNTSSDYRLKENIAPMIGALSVVAALNPVTYNWKIDGSDGQGFIAHELQAVVPDAVVGEKDAVDAEGNPVYQGIDTSFLVATLTAAIQELKAIVDEQAAKITALDARCAVLENK